MFADTGIPLLFEAVQARARSRGRMVVRLAGGAQVMDSQGTFQIGKRNYLAARKILWKAGILITSEAVGGGVSRTTRLEVRTGRMWVGKAAEPIVSWRPAARPCRDATENHGREV